MTQTPPAPNDIRTPPAPSYSAQDLTRGGTQAWILHRDQIYVLRITRAGKLILTK